MSIDFRKIEDKWQKRWEEEKVFEVEPNQEKEKFFHTTPYPYISGSLHIGHGRAVTESDIYCRYLRMKGLNVLFPLSFHITGTPVLGISAAIESGDQRVIQMYEKYLSAYEDSKKKIGELIQSFIQPQNIVDYFIPKMIHEYKQLGLGIDWRRSFTTGDKLYNQMITWQFTEYDRLGYLKKDRYPVLYSPKDQSAMGEDDIIDGDSSPVEKQDFIWIKFKLKNSDLILMAGTTRPDALYGQSNMWVDPKGDYVVAQVGEEKWVVGRSALEKIEYQYVKPTVIRDIKPSELIGKWVAGPLIKKQLYVLPAEFIDSKIGSGIVYSALEDPVDLYQLEKLQTDKKLQKKWSLEPKTVSELKPTAIIHVEGMGGNLGKEIGKEFGIGSPNDKEKIAKAKGELNRRVFRKGVMRDNCYECAGKTVPQTQEYLKKKLVEDGDAVMFYEPSRKAFSRSGGEIIVAMLDDQWFLNFNAKDWKKKAYAALEKIEISPKSHEKTFKDAFEWLDKRPCARKRGLGTPLPQNKDWIVESLSDSTIYMNLYTFQHLLIEHGIKPEQLTKEFFDYVFSSKGTPKEVSSKTKIPKNVVSKIKESFEYWMPLDIRHTFPLHIANHLSFMIFAYAGLFKEKYWPKKISIHGLIISEGVKMSKSKGNAITLLEIKEKYGADVFRFYITQANRVSEVFDWRNSEAQNAKKHIQNLHKTIAEAIQSKSAGEFPIEFKEKFEQLKLRATQAIEKFELRDFNIQAVYEVLNLVKKAKVALSTVECNAFYEYIVSDWIKLIAPVTPHIAEELWSSLGKKTLLATESWPKASKVKESKKDEDLTVKTLQSLTSTMGRLSSQPSKVFVYVVPFEFDSLDIKRLGKELGLDVSVFAVNDKGKFDPSGKAKKAKPGLPSFYFQ